jgi:capsular exopolysaccharide synthesis family protein
MLERLPSPDQLDRKIRGRGMDSDDDVHITAADIAYLLHRHARLIFVAILAGLAISGLSVLTTAPTFTARAQVLIDVQTPQTLPQRQGEITVAIDTTQVESQLAIMRSDNLATTVVEQLGLARDPEFVSHSPSLVQRLIGIFAGRASGPLTPEDAQRVAVLALQDRLEVRRQGLSFAIDIYVRSLSPEKAAKIANIVAEVYVADQLNTRAKAAHQGSEWLEDRIDQLRRHMNNAALRVQEFKARRDYRIVGKGDRPPGQPQAGEPGQTADPATLEELESTSTTYRRMYESFLQAYTDSVQRQSYPISNARVITPASRPFGKSHPKTTLTLAVGGLLGALLGLATALIRQNLDQSVRSAQQIRNKIGIDCLGELPRISRPAPLARGSLIAARPQNDRAAGHASLHETALAQLKETLRKVKLQLETRLSGDRQEHERAHWHEVNDAPFSPFSEALGHLKLRITMGRRTTPVKTLGITSALPAEGKSTIASNLAELYSLHGSRTVIVDTDVRKSVISRALAPDAETGLIDVLAGNADLASCLIPDKLSTLTVLPVGDAAGAANAPELFGSERMQKVIEELAGEFEMVVFDMPPLELVKDGLALSPLLDGILVISEWGETPLPLLADTVDALRQANAHVLGAVFSKVHGPLARNYRQHGRPYLVELKGSSMGKRYSRLA